MEHLDDLNAKNEESDFWQYCKNKHGAQLKKFKINIVETFKGDPTLRQINEAVRIERMDPKKMINKRIEYKPTSNTPV